MNLLESIWTSCMRDLGRTRLTYLSDDGEAVSLSAGELIRTVDRQAETLSPLTSQGDRVLLAYPPGLEFVTSFLACLRADLVPVPVSSPKPLKPLSRYAAVAEDADAHLAITSDRILELSGALASSNVRWTSPSELGCGGLIASDGEMSDWTALQRDPEDLLFLQYTSGSTSLPKGVMVSNRNVISNLAAIQSGFQIDKIEASRRVVCSWLPTYHDMGLVGVLLAALVHDGHAVLMSPSAFVASPLQWIRAMSEYAATITVAPTFGYQWATSKIPSDQLEGIDLSPLQVAACGAEPVKGSVLDQFAEKFAPSGFRAETFYPCYGLAESTLMATGTDREVSVQNGGPNRLNVSRSGLRDGIAKECVAIQDVSTQADDDFDTVISSGVVHGNGKVAICDAGSGKSLKDGHVGEIRVQSPSVVMGYWNNSQATEESFPTDESGRWLRTGDLGFLHKGELYVTGRIKDVIIIGGQNHYPQDIELAAVEAMNDVAEGLFVGGLAAFSIPPSEDDTAPGGLLPAMERVVLCCEVPRNFDPSIADEVFQSIRLAVAKSCDVTLDEILLVRPVSLSRTSSGKIQRRLNAQRIRDGRSAALVKEPSLATRSKARMASILSI